MTHRRLTASLIAAATLALIAPAAAETLPVPPVDPAQPAHAAMVRKAVYHPRRAKTSPADQAYDGPAVFPAAASRSRFDPAPTPDDEVAPAHVGPGEVTTEPKLFTVKTVFRGDGYPYGATAQGLDDKYQIQIPGLNVTVPLHQ